jgi:hypothetical protein
MHDEQMQLKLLFIQDLYRLNRSKVKVVAMPPVKRKELPSKNRNQLFCILLACLIVWLLTLSYSLELEVFTTLTDLMINQQWKHVPPATNLSISFTQKLGIVEMQHSSVSIVGVGRNIAENFPRLVENIHTLAIQFNVSQAVFVEGDSSDNSGMVLQEWASKSPTNRHVISTNSSQTFDKLGPFKGMKLPREGRISEARNLVLQKLRKLPPTDYIIWVDMDVLGWDNMGIQDSFGRTHAWDGICAHGILLHGLYRDTYALRALDFNNNHHLFGDDHDLYNISTLQAVINRKQYKVQINLCVVLILCLCLCICILVGIFFCVSLSFHTLLSFTLISLPLSGQQGVLSGAHGRVPHERRAGRGCAETHPGGQLFWRVGHL